MEICNKIDFSVKKKNEIKDHQYFFSRMLFLSLQVWHRMLVNAGLSQGLEEGLVS